MRIKKVLESLKKWRKKDLFEAHPQPAFNPIFLIGVERWCFFIIHSEFSRNDLTISSIMLRRTENRNLCLWFNCQIKENQKKKKVKSEQVL